MTACQKPIQIGIHPEVLLGVVKQLRCCSRECHKSQVRTHVTFLGDGTCSTASAEYAKLQQIHKKVRTFPGLKIFQ